MKVYFFCRPIDKATLKKRVMACIGDIDRWLACNRLKLNPAKAEFLWFATARHLHLVDNSVFHFENGDVTPATTVRNLSAVFDATCTKVPHVDRLVRAEFYQVRRLREPFVAPSLRRRPLSWWTALWWPSSTIVIAYLLVCQPISLTGSSRCLTVLRDWSTVVESTTTWRHFCRIICTGCGPRRESSLNVAS